MAARRGADIELQPAVVGNDNIAADNAGSAERRTGRHVDRVGSCAMVTLDK
jgi:hypothetical protein